jgi:pentapeptide repeat protein
MTRDESIALYETAQAAERAKRGEGRKVWNAWAEEMLAKKAELERKGEWDNDPDNRTAWHEAAAVDFSDQQFIDAHFYRFIIPADANFNNIDVAGVAGFGGAVFRGNTSFDNASFQKLARFGQTQFDGTTHFNGARFIEDANLYQVDFKENTTFIGTQFRGDALFSGSIFNGTSNFRVTQFRKSADFRGAMFEGGAEFNDAEFQSITFFDTTTFRGKADFGRATFASETGFTDASFSGPALFFSARFGSFAWFDGAKFKGVSRFDRSTFDGNARFQSADFMSHTHFNRSTFSAEADFGSCTFVGDADFHLAYFSGHASFEGSEFGSQCSFRFSRFDRSILLDKASFTEVPNFVQANISEPPPLDAISIDQCRSVGLHRPDTATCFRSLKSLALESNDHDSELTFFAGEIISRRGVHDFALPRPLEIFRAWKLVSGERKLVWRWQEGTSPERAMCWPGGVRYWAGQAYETLSDFGRSMLRPLGWWVVFMAMYAVAYLSQYFVALRNTTALGGLIEAYYWAGTWLLGKLSFGAFPAPAELACRSASKLVEASNMEPWGAAGYVAARRALILNTGDDDDKLSFAYACLYGDYSDEMTNGDPTRSVFRVIPHIPDAVSVLAIMQSPLSAALIFLFLLAVRNHFRIK